MRKGEWDEEREGRYEGAFIMCPNVERVKERQGRTEAVTSRHITCATTEGQMGVCRPSSPLSRREDRAGVH